MKKNIQSKQKVLQNHANPSINVGQDKSTKQENSLKKNISFPIVGIGASAGGLGAFEKFFGGFSDQDSAYKIAFIIVQHLAPNHKSILSEIISRYTKMQVFEVEDGMIIKPGCVYIIPPNRDMSIFHGTLSLIEPASPRGLRLPIDYFFKSLATNQKERAISIILSGTGSDGTLGAREIKAEGGIIIAQKPDTAEYDNMPRSAIAANLADYVLPPEEIPTQLISYITHAFSKIEQTPFPEVPKTEDSLKKIFRLLRGETSHDFSQYKHNTINRRIERRMSVNQIQRLEDYISLLKKNPKEIEALFRDLLIGVTSFFRDKDAFEFLEEKIIPELFAGKKPGALIRVWVTSCSTGEEAYSIGILIQEHMVKLKQDFQVQIFATDIDPKAIEQARSGNYPANIAADIEPIRLSRFFDREPGAGTYKVKKVLRNMLIFSEQNLIRDPPFSKVDLISCRNLLIYLNADIQKKIIPLFHYALIAGGKLFLGSSETVGDFQDLFKTIDRKFKLYLKKDYTRSEMNIGLGKFFTPQPKKDYEMEIKDKKTKNNGLPFREIIEQNLLKCYSPTGALVNKHGDILYLHGRTGQYIEPSPGKSEMNILKMAREGLGLDLTSALHKAVKLQETVSIKGIKIKTNGAYSTVNLKVQPMTIENNEAPENKIFMVVFEDVQASDQNTPQKQMKGKKDKTKGNLSTDSDMEALRRKLKEKEEYLQATNEELETTNEELNSSNEEMQSVNEELQSTNEELETSKEELQSVNEELSTVNAELQTKVADLSRANNDMNNLLAGTGVGTIFLNHDLIIQRFTPSITKIVNLIPTDIGRPVGDIVAKLANYDRLEDDVRDVLDELIPKEIEVESKDGSSWYLLHMKPYRTIENVIEGAVITFVDITKVKLVENTAREAERKRRLLFETMKQGVVFLDKAGNIMEANASAERILGLNLDQMKRRQPVDPKWKTVHEDGSPLSGEKHPAMIALKTGKEVLEVIMGICSPQKEKTTWIKVSAFPQFNEGDDRPCQVYTIFDDISEEIMGKRE